MRHLVAKIRMQILSPLRIIKMSCLSEGHRGNIKMTRQNGPSDQDYGTHAGPYSVILRLVEADVESQLMIEKSNTRAKLGCVWTHSNCLLNETPHPATDTLMLAGVALMFMCFG